MARFVAPHSKPAADSSVGVADAPLDSILCTEELARRPQRPPDFEKENVALVALCAALGDTPNLILQILADKVLEVVQADSAGLSLLTEDDNRFYWAAIAGAWRPHIGGGTPRDFGPCGDVLNRNSPLLFTHWEKRYPYLRTATPFADEGLLVPFYVNGTAVGTIWAIAHTKVRRFDSEDLRLLESLGRFASTAYQAVCSNEDLRAQIRAREKAEEELRAQAKSLNAKVRRLVDTNIMGIFIWNFMGEIIETNEAFRNLIGYRADDIAASKLRWRDLTPAEWSEADELCVADLEATGIARPYEKECLRKDGQRVPVLFGAANFEDRKEGVAFVIDLSKRKRAEAAIEERETKERQLINAAHDAVMTIDEKGRVTDWNTSAQSMFGWRQEEVLGRRLAELVIPKRYRSDCEQGLRRFLATGDRPIRNRLLEITAVRRDGSEFPAELAVTSYRLGGSWAFSGFIRDISERKRAEDSLRRLREIEMELAHANRVASLGQLSASIAHEVNQPIAAAITNAEAALRWLKSEPPDPARAEQALSRIVMNGDRAVKVVDGIRAFVKKEPPRNNRLDINEAILEVLALTRNETIKNSVLVRTRLAETLPAVQGDRVQLQQVVLNLIINAIEAMVASGKENSRELQISTTSDSDAVRVAVRDWGPGLAPAHSERAFEPFYTTKSDGLGMGLSICRSIVEAHGGQMWVMANEPHGAIFQFTLPTPQ